MERFVSVFVLGLQEAATRERRGERGSCMEGGVRATIDMPTRENLDQHCSLSNIYKHILDNTRMYVNDVLGVDVDLNRHTHT